MTINCHIPRRNVTIHISNKTRIWEHYGLKIEIFVKNPNFGGKSNILEKVGKKIKLDGKQYILWEKIKILVKHQNFRKNFFGVTKNFQSTQSKVWGKKQKFGEMSQNFRKKMFWANFFGQNFHVRNYFKL